MPILSAILFSNGLSVVPMRKSSACLGIKVVPAGLGRSSQCAGCIWRHLIMNEALHCGIKLNRSDAKVIPRIRACSVHHADAFFHSSPWDGSGHSWLRSKRHDCLQEEHAQQRWEVWLVSRRWIQWFPACGLSLSLASVPVWNQIGGEVVVDDGNRLNGQFSRPA